MYMDVPQNDRVYMYTLIHSITLASLYEQVLLEHVRYVCVCVSVCVCVCACALVCVHNLISSVLVMYCSKRGEAYQPSMGGAC